MSGPVGGRWTPSALPGSSTAPDCGQARSPPLLPRCRAGGRSRAAVRLSPSAPRRWRSTSSTTRRPLSCPPQLSHGPSVPGGPPRALRGSEQANASPHRSPPALQARSRPSAAPRISQPHRLHRPPPRARRIWHLAARPRTGLLRRQPRRRGDPPSTISAGDDVSPCTPWAHDARLVLCHDQPKVPAVHTPPSPSQALSLPDSYPFTPSTHRSLPAGHPRRLPNDLPIFWTIKGLVPALPSAPTANSPPKRPTRPATGRPTAHASSLLHPVANTHAVWTTQRTMRSPGRPAGLTRHQPPGSAPSQVATQRSIRDRHAALGTNVPGPPSMPASAPPRDAMRRSPPTWPDGP